MLRTNQLSHAALIGLDQTREQSAIPSGPTFLEGVLWELEFREQLTC